MEKSVLEDLAWEWVKHRIRPNDPVPIDCLVFYNTAVAGYTAEFYNFETDEKFHNLFITVPMMNKLIAGTNPKKVRNDYFKTPSETSN